MTTSSWCVQSQAEGIAEKAEGKVQNTVGGLKDTIREIVSKE